MRYLGIDIGGTAIKYGVYDEHGIPYRDEHGERVSVRHDLDSIVDLLHGIICEFEDLDAVGLSIPGAVNSDTGLVIEGGAVEPLGGHRIGEILQVRTGIRTVIENDANCAVLAEHWIGNGQGVQNLVCVTIGTGIGGGMMLDGKLYTGSHFFAGEFGYLVTKAFESYDELEIMSDNSATEALVFKVADALGIERTSLDGKNVFELLESGNPEVETIYQEWIRCLATGIYNIAFVLDPEMILLGGGVSAVERIKVDVTEALAQMTPYAQHWKIDVCKHFNNAGKIGAAYKCRQIEENI